MTLDERLESIGRLLTYDSGTKLHQAVREMFWLVKGLTKLGHCHPDGMGPDWKRKVNRAFEEAFGSMEAENASREIEGASLGGIVAAGQGPVGGGGPVDA